MTWSFSLGPGVAVSCSAPGSPGSAPEDAIRRPDPSGASGVEVMALTTSAAASVSTSMPVTFHFSSGRRSRSWLTRLWSSRGGAHQAFGDAYGHAAREAGHHNQ